MLKNLFGASDLLGVHSTVALQATRDDAGKVKLETIGLNRMIRLTLAVLYLAAYSYAETAPTYETVVLSKGRINFPLRPADREANGQYCPRNMCACDSDVSYIRVSTRSASKAVTMINRELKAEASRVRCVYPDATDTMRQEVTHLSARFLSVVERSYSQQIGTGGSCHGSSAVHTFDLSTGGEYLLTDIIGRSSLANLRSTLPDSIVREHNRQDEEQSEEEDKANAPSGYPHTPYVEPPEDFARDLKSAREGVASLGDEQLLRSSIFIQKSRVFINVGGYYLSCAAGSFHPAEIPASLITLPVIRKELVSH